MQSYRNVFLIIIILCVGFIIYSNILDGSFQFDDYGSVVDNPSIRNLSNLKAIWNFWPTRFITYLSFALNYRLDSLDVFHYHLFNLLVHLGTAILVWWLTVLTLSTPILKDKEIARHSNLIASFVALIFITHPIQTEGVTYIAQRATLLTAFFYLFSICLYAKARLSRHDELGLNILQFYYYGSIITAGIAMFTKEIAISLPLMIFLYEISFLKSEKGADWKKLAPFFVLISVVPFTMLATKSVNFPEMRRLQEGAPNISPIHYLLTQFRVIVTYIRLTFMPINQILDYDYRISKTLMGFPTMASLIFFLLILIMAARIFNKYRLISFGVFWFFLSLLPESGIIPIEDVIFEHRLYLPMAGFSLFFGKRGVLCLWKEID